MSTLVDKTDVKYWVEYSVHGRCWIVGVHYFKGDAHRMCTVSISIVGNILAALAEVSAAASRDFDS